MEEKIEDLANKIPALQADNRRLELDICRMQTENDMLKTSLWDKSRAQRDTTSCSPAKSFGKPIFLKDLLVMQVVGLDKFVVSR